MPKHSTRKERQGKTRFLLIEKWELDCPAFNALLPNEFRIYLYLRSLYNGGNNGEIHLSVRRAAKLIHKSAPTASRAIKRLIKLGFIKVHTDSSFGQKRMARTFELTAISMQPATRADKIPPGSKEFQRFRSIKQIQGFEKSQRKS